MKTHSKMKKFNTITRRSVDSNGCPSKTMVTLTEEGTILVKQRFFTEEKNEQAEILRTWKGMYYIERHIHTYHETFIFIIKAAEKLIKHNKL